VVAEAISLLLSAIALIVSLLVAYYNFRLARQKSAKDMWQRIIELYIQHPSHLLGRSELDTEESTQAYRVHVAFMFMAFEEILEAFPNDTGWENIVRRHLLRHAAYVREVLHDPERNASYSTKLRAKMAAVGQPAT
jgi:hypothetical protein